MKEFGTKSFGAPVKSSDIRDTHPTAEMQENFSVRLNLKTFLVAVENRKNQCLSKLICHTIQ